MRRRPVKRSLVRAAPASRCPFAITDTGEKDRRRLRRHPPDLFREGQGVVAEGALDAKGVVKADNVLAKHDERYMPREVADALKKQGRLNEGSAAAGSPKSSSENASAVPSR